MPDGNETTNTEQPDKGKADDLVSRSELEKVIEQRQAAKQKLRELEDYKATKEAEEKAAAEERMLDEKRYQDLLAAKDQDLASLQEEISKRDAAEAKRAAQTRRTKFLDALEKMSGLSGKRVVLDGLLSVLERDGLDATAESTTEKDVRDALERMRPLDQDTFKPKDLGPKGAPGTTGQIDVNIDDAKRVEELAKRLSWRGSKRAG